MAWMALGTRIRALIAVCGAAVIGTALGSCGLIGKPVGTAESMVRHFGNSLSSRNASEAATLTSYPSEAQDTINQVFRGLSPQNVNFDLSQYINLDADDGFFTMDVAWDFGRGESWSYQVRGKTRRLPSVGWRILWDPGMLVPGLGQGRTIRLVPAYGPPTPILDNYGAPLLHQQNLNVVELDPRRTRDAAASARAVTAAIAPVAPLITDRTLLEQLDDAHGNPIVAVRLRDSDFAPLSPHLAHIPGVTVTAQPEMLPFDRELDSPLIDALREVWQRNRDLKAGWAVQLYDPNGMPVGTPETGFQPPAGPSIRSTLDPKLQLAAENAAAYAGSPTTIVAITPSTGAVPAAAQNNAADAEGSVALTGLYSTGSTMDLLAAGAAANRKVRVEDVATHDVLGVVHRLGIGADLTVPGLPVLTGDVPGTRLLVDAIRLTSPNPGVVASPFGMALAAATIERGSMPMPIISYWERGTTRTPVGALRPAVVDRLRQLMNEHPAPGVSGFTATAGDDAWFVGYRGDLAFAVHISKADDSDEPGRVVGRLFGAH